MSDLRRSATEIKRDHDHKAKWAHGVRPHNQGRRLEVESYDWREECIVPKLLRPALPPSSATQHLIKRCNEPDLRAAHNAIKKRFRHDVKEALSSESSSSGEDWNLHEDGDTGAIGTAPDASDVYNILYAVSGNTVLSSAVSSAEIKYETKMTEKLVKEYEFIAKDVDEPGVGYVADVDDFEIIEHVAM